MKKRISFLVLIFVLLFQTMSTIGGFVAANEFVDSNTEDKKFICSAILEDDFADYKVSVVLTKEASMSFKTYTPKDFPEIGCSLVKELSASTSIL